MKEKIYVVTIQGERDDDIYTLKEAYERMENFYCDYLEELSEEEFNEETPYERLENWSKSIEAPDEPFYFDEDVYIEQIINERKEEKDMSIEENEKMYVYIDHDGVVGAATSFEALYGKIYVKLVSVVGEAEADNMIQYFPFDEIINALDDNSYWEDDFTHSEGEEPEYVIITMSKRAFKAFTKNWKFLK